MADPNRTIVYSYEEWEEWHNRITRSPEDHQRITLVEGRQRETADDRRGTQGACPVCGWPAGTKGFLRARALPWEWAFGKLFACPRCWPPPLGRNEEAQLLTDAEEWQARAAHLRLAVRSPSPAAGW